MAKERCKETTTATRRGGLLEACHKVEDNTNTVAANNGVHGWDTPYQQKYLKLMLAPAN